MKPSIQEAKKFVARGKVLMRRAKRQVGIAWQFIEDQKQAFIKSDRLQKKYAPLR